MVGGDMQKRVRGLGWIRPSPHRNPSFARPRSCLPAWVLRVLRREPSVATGSRRAQHTGLLVPPPKLNAMHGPHTRSDAWGPLAPWGHVAERRQHFCLGSSTGSSGDCWRGLLMTNYTK